MYTADDIESLEFQMDLEDGTRDTLTVSAHGVTYETNAGDDQVTGLLPLEADEVHWILETLAGYDVLNWKKPEYLSSEEVVWSVLITLKDETEIYHIGGLEHPDHFEEFVDYMDELVGRVIEEGEEAD